MTWGMLLARQWALALGWTMLASAAVLFTRFDGGVAFLWGATALLIAALIRTSARHWWAPLTACGVASLLVTGFLGLGWAAAVPFLVINLGEAVIAARLMRSRKSSGELMASLSWFGRFVTSLTLAPAAVAPLAALILWWLGADPLTTVIRFFSGHALGNLTVLPIALLLTGRSARKDTRRLLMRKRLDALIVLPLTIAVDTIVFVQSSWPILFLPVMFVVLATFRLGRTGAALSLAALALIGGALTCLGYGPINLLHASAAERILFFQWYLACTVLTIVPVAAELHRRATLLRRVRDSEARFRMLAEHSSDIILHLGRRGEFRFVSPAITRLSGHDPATLIGRRSGEFVHPDDHRLVWSEHRLCFEVPGTTRRYRHRAVLADGSLRWVEAHACAVLDEDGRPDGVISLLRDITESRQEQEQWRSAAMTDRLTGLPNRRSLELAVSRLNGGDHCLALLDLDRFKQVNDTYGHDAGDAVLTGFAEVAQRLVRTHDMVARLGGEEFVILFEHTQIDQAYQVCDRLRRILAQTPLVTPAGPLRITVSGGVAPIGRGGLEAGLKAADEALYRAKRGGRDQLLLAA